MILVNKVIARSNPSGWLAIAFLFWLFRNSYGKKVNYWLMKSEPDTYSIADLQEDGQTIWDGVRNYQARNFLMQMREGDLSFFYHSNTNPPGIVGLMRIVKSGAIDPTQFDSHSPYYDAKSSPDSPRWRTVVVEFVERFPQIVALETLKQMFTPDELLLVRRGNRLSVMPVEAAIAQKILRIDDSHRQADAVTGDSLFTEVTCLDRI